MKDLKLAAGAVLLSPYIPLLFMGEEYGEEAPFLYFISHGDPDLIEAVRKGRKAEFKDFHATGEPPDAYSVETFKRCQLNWEQRTQGKHQILLKFYQKLIELRRQIPALRELNRKNIEVFSSDTNKLLWFRRWSDNSQIFCLMNFGEEIAHYQEKLPAGTWQKQLDSSETQWLGAGSSIPEKLNTDSTLILQPQSLVLYGKA